MRQALQRVPVPGQARASAYPAPVTLPTSGWNSRDQLSQMPPVFALRLDNWVAEDGRLQVRAGYQEHATGVTGGVETLLSYTAPGGGKLFACGNSAIYDVTSSGAVGAAAVSGLTNNRWDAVMFTTAGTDRLVIANGADGIRTYDGSSWATSSITGATASTLKGVTSHKLRLWAIEAGTLSAWYMDTVLAISGGMSELNVGPLCERGGELAALATWTRDGGSGLDDLFVLITSEGEVIVYQGSSPAETSWFMVGRYQIPRPIGGTRCVTRVGGSLMVLTELGVMSMDEVMSGAPVRSRMTDAIYPSFRVQAETRGDSDLWGIIHHTGKQRLICNVPSDGSEWWQYVFSLRTGAWCRFIGQRAQCWAEHDGKLWFGSPDGVVYEADSGLDDDGTPISAEVICAPTSFGAPTLKWFKRARLHFQSDAAIAPSVAIVPDYANPFDVLSSETVTDGTAGAEWDVADWDVAEWGGFLRGQTVTVGLSGYGSVGALRVAVRAQGAIVRMTGAQITIEAGRTL